MFHVDILAEMLFEFFEGRSLRSLEVSYGWDHSVIYKKLAKAVEIIYPIAHHELCTTNMKVEPVLQLDEIYLGTIWGKKPLINIVSTIEKTDASIVLVLKLMKNASDIEVLRAIRLAIARLRQSPKELMLDPFGSHVSVRFQQIVQHRWKIKLNYKERIARKSQLYRAEGINNLIATRLRSGLHGQSSFIIRGFWVHLVFARKREDLGYLSPFEYARRHSFLEKNGWRYLINKAYPLLEKAFRNLESK
jgi:hypothetical protein